MAHQRLLNSANIDLSDSKTRVILGVAAASTALAVGGALYFFSRGESSETPKAEESDEEIFDLPDLISESELILHKTKALSPVEQADKRKAAGNENFKTSHYEEALKCYQEAVELYPINKAVEQSHCYQNMAAVSDKLGRIEDVVKYCSQALSLNKKYIKAIQRRAGAYEKLAKYGASIKDWTAVCLIEGPEKSMTLGHMETSDRVLKLYGQEKAIELFKKRSPTLPSHTVITSAFDNIHMRDFSTDVDPDTLENEADKLYITILLLIEEKKYSTAYDRLLEAKKLEPVKFKAQLACLRGIFAWFMTDYRLAIQCFDSVVEDPMSYMRIKIQALIHRGEVNQARSDSARALMDYNCAVGLDEDHPDPYLHRAQFYLSIERLQEAITDLNRCIALDGDFPAPWQQLVYGQYQMARTMSPALLQEVYSNLGKMTERFPKVADVHALYGQVLQDQKQFSAAEEKFVEASRLSPENVTYKAHLATLKMTAENNYVKALELLNEAARVDPKCDFVLENLGMIYIQKQQYKDALECFDKALQLVKTEPEAAHLSSLYVGIKCQWEVCEEYGVKPVSVSDVAGLSEMMTSSN